MHNPRKPIDDDPDTNNPHARVMYVQQDCKGRVRFPNVFQGAINLKKGQEVKALRANPKAILCKIENMVVWVEAKNLALTPPPKEEQPAE